MNIFEKKKKKLIILKMVSIFNGFDSYYYYLNINI